MASAVSAAPTPAAPPAPPVAVAPAAPSPPPAVTAVPDPQPEAHVEPEPPAAVQPPAVVDLEALRALWPAVVDTVSAEKGVLGAVLREARCTELNDGELVVCFAASKPFNKRRADDADNREVVLEALRTLSGRPLRLRYDIYDDADPQAVPPGATQPPNEEEMIERFKHAFDAREIIPDEEPQP